MARRRKKRKLNSGRFFFLIFCLALLCIGIAGCGIVYSSIHDIPPLTRESLETVAHTIIYDQEGNYITQIGIRNSEPISLKDVPDNLKNAVLSIEDPDFYQHPGFSLRGIARAGWNDLKSGTIVEGGSTITQQLIKISFLSDEQTFKRKIQELILSLQIERQYTKDDILEMYLNNIYLGEGAYGMQAAAQTYFGIDLRKKDRPITLEEAALLAGLPQAPNAYSPFTDPEAAIKRRNLVLDSMVRNNFISSDQAETAKAIKLQVDNKNSAEKQYPYPYFMDYLTDILIEKYGEANVFKGGLRVYTTLDPNIQSIAETAMENNSNFPASGTDANNLLQPQGAVVILDPTNGQIKALVGGREHTQKRQWNRAVQSTRQPGSAFKPIAAYGPAIEYQGMGPASVMDDIPISYGSYSPRNNDGRYRGLITLREALTSSVNVVAVKLLDKVGISESAKFAAGLGIQLDPQSHGLSMALGGLHTGVTPLQMAVAYGAFANQGTYYEPTVITRVEDSNGIILEQSVPVHRQAMKATTAYLITSMLESVVQSGTGTGAQIGRPAAGKTGTTDDGKDIWFVGYTPELVCSVWIGYDTPTAMPSAYGGIYTAEIWREIMSKSLRNVEVTSFKQPSGLVKATVDRKSGLKAGPNTPEDSLVTDLFREGTEPKENDDIHVFVELCAVSGKLPNEYCPDRIMKPMIKQDYDVSSNVEDYDQRVPTEACNVHDGTQKLQNPAIPGGNNRPQTTTGLNNGIRGSSQSNGNNTDSSQDI